MILTNTMNIDLNEIKKYSNLSLLAQKTVEGFIAGLHRSPYKGFSVEFAEHKPYNTGESTKHIDWKLYSRTEKLYHKQFEAETNLRAYLLLDISSSMYYPQESFGKLLFSSYACACLAYLLNKQRDATGFIGFDESIRYSLQAKTSATHLQKIFQTLEIITSKQNQGQTSLGDVLEEVAISTPKRSLIILFTDFFEKKEQLDSLFDSLLHLKHNKNEIIIFHTIDHTTEKDFQFATQSFTFIDIETNEKIKLRPDQIREEFKKANEENYKEIKLKCGEYNIEFVEVDINDPMDQVLLPYLIKRQKMR